MNQNHDISAAREHPAISALIPWYVNGTLGAQDRERLDAHLLNCAQCCADLAQERRVYQGMNAETTVEYMPAASLKRLQARLDGIGAATATDAPVAPSAPKKPGRTAMPWQG